MAVNNDDLLKSAKKNISLIETELGKKLNNYINNENSAIGKLKEQIVVGNIINIKTGKVVENIIIPPEIIDAFAGPVAEKIDDSTISKYSKSKWAKQILSQIAAAVRTIAPIKKKWIYYNL